MSFLSTAVQSVLDRGRFCLVAAETPAGPHCTPLVFAYSGGRVWLTTSRRSVKARAWRERPWVGGLVRDGELAVTFTGSVRTFDLLDWGTWADTVQEAPRLTRATVTFSRKNARFFAGYAVDARQVPLAWTPPGRVFVGIDLERTALLDGGVQEGSSRWGGEVASAERFRASRTGESALARLPSDVREPLADGGAGALALAGSRGPVVLPARWRVEGRFLYVALPSESLALADVGSEVAAALTMDEPSIWRARDMVGAMAQGTGEVFALGRVSGGDRSLKALVRSIDPAADALVRVRPLRLVWWHGWASGSVVVA